MRWTSNPVDGSKDSVCWPSALGDLKLNVPAGTLPVLADLLVRRGI